MSSHPNSIPLLELKVTEEQEALSESIAAFLKNEMPPNEIVQMFRVDDEQRRQLHNHAGELGWLGLLVPSAYGGGGATLRDCAVAFEEFGKAPLPNSLFSRGVLAPAVVMEGGSEAQRHRWLPEMLTGATAVAIADVDSGAGWDSSLVESRLVETGDGYRISGCKRYVHDADSADVFICAARHGDEASGISLALVERSATGLSVRSHQGSLLDVSEVEFDAVHVPPDRILGIPGAGWQILERAVKQSLPVLCSFMVGACEAVFEFTLQYTRDRFAFGQPIGRFQRVQDHVVELANHMDAARLVTRELLWRVESGQPVDAEIHEAKAVASDAYYEACNYSHMVHAGPGTDLEHPLMVHTLLSRTLFQYLGDPGSHRRRMMDLLFPD